MGSIVLALVSTTTMTGFEVDPEMAAVIGCSAAAAVLLIILVILCFLLFKPQDKPKRQQKRVLVGAQRADSIQQALRSKPVIVQVVDEVLDEEHVGEGEVNTTAVCDRAGNRNHRAGEASNIRQSVSSRKYNTETEEEQGNKAENIETENAEDMKDDVDKDKATQGQHDDFQTELNRVLAGNKNVTGTKKSRDINKSSISCPQKSSNNIGCSDVGIKCSETENIANSTVVCSNFTENSDKVTVSCGNKHVNTISQGYPEIHGEQYILTGMKKQTATPDENDLAHDVTAGNNKCTKLPAIHENVVSVSAPSAVTTDFRETNDNTTQNKVKEKNKLYGLLSVVAAADAFQSPMGKKKNSPKTGHKTSACDESEVKQTRSGAKCNEPENMVTSQAGCNEVTRHYEKVNDNSVSKYGHTANERFSEIYGEYNGSYGVKKETSACVSRQNKLGVESTAMVNKCAKMPVIQEETKSRENSGACRSENTVQAKKCTNNDPSSVTKKSRETQDNTTNKRNQEKDKINGLLSTVSAADALQSPKGRKRNSPEAAHKPLMGGNAANKTDGGSKKDEPHKTLNMLDESSGLYDDVAVSSLKAKEGIGSKAAKPNTTYKGQTEYDDLADIYANGLLATANKACENVNTSSSNITSKSATSMTSANASNNHLKSGLLPTTQPSENKRDATKANYDLLPAPRKISPELLKKPPRATGNQKGAKDTSAKSLNYSKTQSEGEASANKSSKAGPGAGVNKEANYADSGIYSATYRKQKGNEKELEKENVEMVENNIYEATCNISDSGGSGGNIYSMPKKSAEDPKANESQMVLNDIYGISCSHFDQGKHDQQLVVKKPTRANAVNRGKQENTSPNYSNHANGMTLVDNELYGETIICKSENSVSSLSNTGPLNTSSNAAQKPTRCKIVGSETQQIYTQPHADRNKFQDDIYATPKRNEKADNKWAEMVDNDIYDTACDSRATAFSGDIYATPEKSSKENWKEQQEMVNNDVYESVGNKEHSVGYGKLQQSLNLPNGSNINQLPDIMIQNDLYGEIPKETPKVQTEVYAVPEKHTKCNKKGPQTSVPDNVYAIPEQNVNSNKKESRTTFQDNVYEIPDKNVQRNIKKAANKAHVGIYAEIPDSNMKRNMKKTGVKPQDNVYEVPDKSIKAEEKRNDMVENDIYEAVGNADCNGKSYRSISTNHQNLENNKQIASKFPPQPPKISTQRGMPSRPPPPQPPKISINKTPSTRSTGIPDILPPPPIANSCDTLNFTPRIIGSISTLHSADHKGNKTDSAAHLPARNGVRKNAKGDEHYEENLIYENCL